MRATTMYFLYIINCCITAVKFGNWRTGVKSVSCQWKVTPTTVVEGMIRKKGQPSFICMSVIPKQVPK